MSCAIILHGPIGCGKTMTCHGLMEKARNEGIPLGGVITQRYFVDDLLKGYDCMDISTGETFPLARLVEDVEGDDWYQFSRLKYTFSHSGFEHANSVLSSSADLLSQGALVFVDEFGRLERKRQGLFPGVFNVVEALKDGGIAVFACRSNFVENVTQLLKGRARRVYRREPGNLESLWTVVSKQLAAPETPE